MKGKNLILTGIIAAAVGAVLILFRDSLASGDVVIAAGIIFVVAAVLNTMVFLASRDKDGNTRTGVLGMAFGWVVSAASLVLGLAMIIFKGAFVDIIGFMFAVLVLFTALFQMFILLFGSRPTRLSSWFFLVPTALTAIAVYTFLQKPSEAGEHIIMIVTGAAFLLFGLATIVEGAAIGQVNHTAHVAAKKASKEAKQEITEHTEPAKAIEQNKPVAEQETDTTTPQP